VVALDRVAVLLLAAGRRAGLYHVRIQRPLCSSRGVRASAEEALNFRQMPQAQRPTLGLMV